MCTINGMTFRAPPCTWFNKCQNSRRKQADYRPPPPPNGATGPDTNLTRFLLIFSLFSVPCNMDDVKSHFK